MAKTTFTESEQAAIVTAIGWMASHPNPDKATIKKLQSLHDKMVKAKEKSATDDTIAVATLLRMARETLGERLREHPNPTPTWFSLMRNRLKVNGITQDVAIRALENIKNNWRGEIFIDVLINSLAKYSVMEIGKPKAPVSKGWLGQMEQS